MIWTGVRPWAIGAMAPLVSASTMTSGLRRASSSRPGARSIAGSWQALQRAAKAAAGAWAAAGEAMARTQAANAPKAVAIDPRTRLSPWLFLVPGEWLREFGFRFQSEKTQKCG